LELAEVLDAASKRNAGRDVTLEENDPALVRRCRHADSRLPTSITTRCYAVSKCCA
jgi:hypothetical protein